MHVTCTRNQKLVKMDAKSMRMTIFLFFWYFPTYVLSTDTSSTHFLESHAQENHNNQLLRKETILVHLKMYCSKKINELHHEITLK